MWVKRAEKKRSEFQPVQNSSMASMAYETKFSTSATSCLPVLLHLHYFQPHLTWLNMTHTTYESQNIPGF